MQFPNIDPVFLKLGPLHFRWYGLMYVLTFVISYFIMSSEVKRKNIKMTKEEVSDLLFYGALGVIIGARLGYILFYNLAVYINDPFKIFAVWEGGMSFHGGFIGLILAFFLFSRKKGLSFYEIIDMAAQCAPVGFLLGRIGNFINGELFGRVTTSSWGMIFPDGGPLPRHPSQLYESFLEGIVLFVIVKTVALKSNTVGTAAWTLCAGYGLFRFIVEFFREPDAQIGFFGQFTMGQLLSFPMLLVGTIMLIVLHRKRV